MIPSEEELAVRARDYMGFPDMSDEEKQDALKRTEEWLNTFTDEEKEEILKRLQNVAGVSDEDHETLHYLQQLTWNAIRKMDDEAEVFDLYGFTEDQMQLYARWLDMEAFRFDELNDMGQQESWVTGMLMGIVVGILMERKRDG